MNEILNQHKTTITTLEIAEMMEMDHGKLLRKLDGDKSRKGYIQILGETQMGITDFFIKSRACLKIKKYTKRLFIASFSW